MKSTGVFVVLLSDRCVGISDGHGVVWVMTLISLQIDAAIDHRVVAAKGTDQNGISNYVVCGFL